MVKKEHMPSDHHDYFDYMPHEYYKHYDAYASYHHHEPHHNDAEEDSSFDESVGDEDEWIVDRNLRAITEHGENLTRMAEETRNRYKSDVPNLMYL